jgi:hypothetical protein
LEKLKKENEEDILNQETEKENNQDLEETEKKIKRRVKPVKMKIENNGKRISFRSFFSCFECGKKEKEQCFG